MKRYRKKPVVVEAVQYLGENHAEILEFCGEEAREENKRIFIDVANGTMEVMMSDYVIKGIAGEFYPCSADIFSETYEEVL